MNVRRVGLMPLPSLALLTGALYLFVKPSLFYDPPWLTTIYNLLFIAVICFIVAYTAMKNYRATSRVLILLLGCGVLSLGLGAAVSGGSNTGTGDQDRYPL